MFFYNSRKEIGGWFICCVVGVYVVRLFFLRACDFVCGVLVRDLVFGLCYLLVGIFIEYLLCRNGSIESVSDWFRMW